MLFTLNPGYTPPTSRDNNCNDDWWHTNSAELRAAYRSNFNEEPMHYPMFFLDPQFANNPGGRYWNAKLSGLIRECGREAVARNLVTIEFFPYHSNRFRGGCKVPSQDFAHYQLRRAMERRAVVLIVRARAALLRAMPDLNGYPYLTVNSRQRLHIPRKRAAIRVPRRGHQKRCSEFRSVSMSLMPGVADNSMPLPAG